jgi:hypothetical protein
VVSEKCLVPPDSSIHLSDYLLQIIKAIILQENGSQPYSDDVINFSISLAEG